MNYEINIDGSELQILKDLPFALERAQRQASIKVKQLPIVKALSLNKKGKLRSRDQKKIIFEFNKIFIAELKENLRVLIQ